MAVKETGIIRTKDARALCASCGSSIENGGAVFTGHMDGTTFYTNIFQCRKCGARIEQTFDRDAEDAAWWM